MDEQSSPFSNVLFQLRIIRDHICSRIVTAAYNKR